MVQVQEALLMVLLMCLVYRMVTSLVFYGFLLYISDLPGDPYLNLVIMFVVSDLPGIVVAWISIQK